MKQQRRNYSTINSIDLLHSLTGNAPFGCSRSMLSLMSNHCLCEVEKAF